MARAKNTAASGESTDAVVDTPETRAAEDAGRETTTTHAEALETGYLGSPVDPRPNSHYTVGNEQTRADMVAEGMSPDRPPGEEKVGPTREEALVENATAPEGTTTDGTTGGDTGTTGGTGTGESA